MVTPKTEFEVNRTLEGNPKSKKARAYKAPKQGVRQSEFPVSEHGMNQESEQNKYSRPPKGARKHQ